MKSLPRSMARDVFSYLLGFSMLYVGIVSFITLIFQYIEIKFPDVLGGWYSSNLETIRISMATLVVVWPVCILINHLIDKDRARSNGKSDAGIRKWLIYLTLFVTAITMVVDLITLVNYFLNGEITTRFVLKVLVVLVTVGLVFWFELWDLKNAPKETGRISKMIGIASLLVMVGVVIGGFFLVGSPAEQRKARLDDQRVNDLSIIQNELTFYFQQKQTLPATLDELSTSLNGFIPPVDPVSGAAYEFTVIKPGPDEDILNRQPKFELCATFDAESTDYQNVMVKTRQYPMMDYAYGQNWQHAAGRVCFERTIDPDLYPPLK